MIAWIYYKDKQRPANIKRQIKRGKHKGKYLATIHENGNGKKILIKVKPLTKEA